MHDIPCLCDNTEQHIEGMFIRPRNPLNGFEHPDLSNRLSNIDSPTIYAPVCQSGKFIGNDLIGNRTKETSTRSSSPGVRA